MAGKRYLLGLAFSCAGTTASTALDRSYPAAAAEPFFGMIASSLSLVTSNACCAITWGGEDSATSGHASTCSTETCIACNNTACLSADETACRTLKACTTGIVCVFFPTVICTVMLFQLIMGLNCCRKGYPNTIGKEVVITQRKSLRCRVPTTTVTRTKCAASMDWPFDTLTRIGSFNGTGLSPACFTTSALMNESDAPESSNAKYVVPFRIKGRNNNDIGGGGSDTYSLMSEAASAAGAIHMPASGAIHMLHEAGHTLHAVRMNSPGSARATLRVPLVEVIHRLLLAGHTLHAV